MLLENKKLLITGVLTDDSIAWHTARVAQEEGAEIVVTKPVMSWNWISTTQFMSRI